MKKEGIFHTLWILMPKNQKVILVFHNYKMFWAAASDFSHLRQPHIHDILSALHNTIAIIGKIWYTTVWNR